MSPFNRGLASRVPGAHPLPPPRFGGRHVSPGMPPSRMPPLPPINPIFGGPMRQQLLPRPVGGSRPNASLPFFPGPRAHGMAPGPVPPAMRGIPRGPFMRPWPRRVPSPRMIPPIRSRSAAPNRNAKDKGTNNKKRVNELEELELKKPWMTDEIRSEIEKKNISYAKAKKTKDTVEWEEFKDLRDKVTRMMEDAKNEYLAKHPERAHLYPNAEPYDQRDENYVSSEDDTSYYCEICDREFALESIFIQHKTTHKLCGIDGCTFSAHPLLVEKHIRMQHSTGLYQRMKNLSTPEDIEKWIIERKKRYPTKANIELHKAKELEKSQRGEIIKQFPSTHTQTKMRKMTKVHEKKRKSHKRHIREINSNSLHVDKIYRGLHPFLGTSTLQAENLNEIWFDEQPEQIEKDQHKAITDNISDEDDIPQTSLELKPILVANYESGEDEDDMPEEIPIKKIKIENSQNHEITENTIHEKVDNATQSYIDNSNNKLNDKSKDRTKTKANKRSLHSVTKDKHEDKSKTNQIEWDKRNKQISNRHQNKLLEMLLSRSIQHERNLICQCLKYVVDNNFFHPL